VAGHVEDLERTYSFPPSRAVGEPVCQDKNDLPVERFIGPIGGDRIPDDAPDMILGRGTSTEKMANSTPYEPDGTSRSVVLTKALQQKLMKGGNSEVSGRRGIQLHECFYALPLSLQLARYLQRNNASLTLARQVIRARRLDGGNFSDEVSSYILHSREQRLLRNTPFLLKRQDIHVKEGLIAAKRATKIPDAVIVTSGKKRRLRSGLHQWNKRRFGKRLFA